MCLVLQIFLSKYVLIIVLSLHTDISNNHFLIMQTKNDLLSRTESGKDVHHLEFEAVSRVS